MQKISSKKLAISPLTVANLTIPQLRQVAGGGTTRGGDSIVTIEGSCGGHCRVP
jgi:hypothetical protein